jgi:hypothetical protein
MPRVHKRISIQSLRWLVSPITTCATVGYTIGQSRLSGMFPGSLADNSGWILRFTLWNVVLLGAIHWRLGRLVRSQTENPEGPTGLVPATLIFALLVCFGHTILFYDRQYGFEGIATCSNSHAPRLCAHACVWSLIQMLVRDDA